MICNTNSICFEVYKKSKYYPLWFKARKHYFKGIDEIWIENYWFWQFMLCWLESVYIYLKLILLSTWNNFWIPIFPRNRYVESRMYFKWNVYWLSNFSRRKRKRIGLTFYGDSWNTIYWLDWKRIMITSFLFRRRIALFKRK